MWSEVAIDVDKPGRHSGDQFLAPLLIHGFLVRTHRWINVMLIGKSEDRNQRPAVLLAVDEFLPMVLAQRNAPLETGSPVVPVSDTLVVHEHYRQIGVSGLQRATDRIPVLHEEVHELLQLPGSRIAVHQRQARLLRRKLVMSRSLPLPTRRTVLAATAAAASFLPTGIVHSRGGEKKALVHFKTADVAGLRIFYREAGDPSKPTIALLHGFPSSSHQFHDLIPLLADRFHVIAPDYPGMGNSDAPPAAVLRPTFDDVAGVIDALVAQRAPGPLILYLHDIGGPIGLRIATAHPERIAGLIFQNFTMSVEGWNPERLKVYERLGGPETPEKLEFGRGLGGACRLPCKLALDPLWLSLARALAGSDIISWERLSAIRSLAEGAATKRSLAASQTSFRDSSGNTCRTAATAASCAS